MIATLRANQKLKKMSKLNAPILALVSIGLAACTSPSQFDNPVDLNAQPSANAPASDPTSAAYFTSTVGDRVLFAVDESTLSTQARTVLESQALWLNQNTGYAILIEGHADEQGTREYNLALGARRASAVQQYLISQGVAPSRLRTVTFGKERPIEVCSDEACYTKNRRAVTVIAGGTS